VGSYSAKRLHRPPVELVLVREPNVAPLIVTRGFHAELYVNVDTYLTGTR
jgi:hypothetical protein